MGKRKGERGKGGEGGGEREGVDGGKRKYEGRRKGGEEKKEEGKSGGRRKREEERTGGEEEKGMESRERGKDGVIEVGGSEVHT